MGRHARQNSAVKQMTVRPPDGMVEAMSMASPVVIVAMASVLGTPRRPLGMAPRCYSFMTTKPAKPSKAQAISTSRMRIPRHRPD